MGIQSYTIQNHNTNTTFNGVKFILPSSAEFDLTGASIKIDFNKSKSGNSLASLKMTTDNNKITIELPYTFYIAEQMIILEPATYYWDCKITFSDGRKKTYIGGEWTIINTITK